MKLKPRIITLHVPRCHNLKVYIWPTLGSMRNHIRKFVPLGKGKAYGFFRAPRAKVKLGRTNVVMNKIVGEIHLAQDRFGAGIFAHELQHFMSWWSVIKNYDLIGKDWERVSTLAGNLTKSFWRQHL